MLMRIPMDNLDYTTRDYEGFRNDMLTLLKQKIPEYSDFSQSDINENEIK